MIDYAPVAKALRIWDMYVMYCNHGPDSPALSYEEWLKLEQTAVDCLNVFSTSDES